MSPCPNQIEEFNKELEENREKYKSGPISQRSLTDCICCLIFLVAIGGFVGASWYGWKNGNPRQLLIGWDSDRNGCGFTEGFEDYEFLYWPEPPSNDNVDLVKAVKEMNVGAALELLAYGVCVKECPSANQDIPIQCKPTNYIQGNDNYNGCVYEIGLDFLQEWGVDIDAYTGEQEENISANVKFPYRYDTKKMYGFCVPTFETGTGNVSALSDSAIKTFKKLFEDTIMEDKLTSYIADIA